MIKTPSFWNNRGVASTALLPLTFVWQGLAALRGLIAKTSTVSLPVICIGNITVGGTGKTPLVGLLYDALIEHGHRPAILTRGYGGSETGPLWVDGTIHEASACGDEPLMLAENRDVLVSRDRAAGAQTIGNRGIHDVILMDDGMQNPFLEKNLKIGVFDGGVGVGNGRVVPSGPLREPKNAGIAALDIIIINGDDETNLKATLPADTPCYEGRIEPDQSVIESLADTSLLAFAGIGRPQRFFATLRRSGATLAHYLAFADHHPYSQSDLTKLQADALHYGAQLITTQKDWMRLPSDWRDKIAFLPVTMDLPEQDALVAHIIACIEEAAGTTDSAAELSQPKPTPIGQADNG